MNIKMGGQVFVGVQIPLLWGSRAVLQDQSGKLSIIELHGEQATPEIVGDQPAPGTEYVPVVDGFKIQRAGQDLYTYDPNRKILRGISIRLPDCEIGPTETRIGTNNFAQNIIVGVPVGIKVTENGVAIGAPIPPELAKLVV